MGAAGIVTGLRLFADGFWGFLDRFLLGWRGIVCCCWILRLKFRFLGGYCGVVEIWW